MGLIGGQGRKIDLRALQPVEPKVCGSPDCNNLHPRAQHVDEGGKERPVDAVLIEVVRRAVRGRDQHHALGEQGLEQTAQDHGVCNVGDLQFIKT